MSLTIDDFKPGDVVYLNAEPNRHLTVESTFKFNNTVKVAYWDEIANKYVYPSFRPEMLSKVIDPVK